jgi:subtilisin-like proprotein convertase family protein
MLRSMFRRVRSLGVSGDSGHASLRRGVGSPSRRSLRLEPLETRALLAVYANTANLDIVTNDVLYESEIVVPDAITIDDINVRVDIDHTLDEDLDVYLVSPQGTVVELFTDVGSFGQNFQNTTLDDEAGTDITAGTAPFSGSYIPEGDLSDFDGENAAGTWTLQITDDAEGDDNNLLDDWTLTISGLSDYGDAPDGPYPTLQASNGASHIIGDLYLGSAVDDETDGQPDAAATGDDLDGTNDDDGVVPTSVMLVGQNATIDVTVSKDGKLDAWIDFNDDGDWTDGGEHLADAIDVTAGVNNLVIPIPATAEASDLTFARIRVSPSGAGITGNVLNGEVEDYAIQIGLANPVMTAEPTYSAGDNNTVYWGAVDGADEYFVEIDTDPGFGTATNTGWISATEHNFSGLADDTSYSFRVKARANGVESGWSNVETTLQYVNDPPTIVLNNTTTTLAEDQDLTAALKVADIVVTDDFEDPTSTNALTLTGADAAMFEIVGTELFLSAGQTLDFETNPELDVNVDVDDATITGDPDDTASLQITLTDVDEPPIVTLENTTTAIDENTDTTAAIKVADISVWEDALGSNSLSLSGADAASFEIVGTELFLKAGTVLDFEAQAQFNVTVDVDDPALGATPDSSAPLVLDVTDLNEPPTIALANTTTTLPEDQDLTAALKVADIVVTDDALGTNDLALTGADAALFEIVGMELFLKSGQTLDFETNPQLDVTIEVDDAAIGAGIEDSDALTVAVTDVNEAPSVALTNVTTAIDENTDTTAAIKVADIVVTDDALGSESLSLSGADAATFEIVGTELFIKAGTVLDFEAQAQYNVAVDVDDLTVGATPDDTAPLALDVTDVNEAPSLALANVVTTLPEDTATPAKVADIVVTDDALGVNNLTLVGADAAIFEIVGTELFIKAGETLDFETNPQLDVTVELDDPEFVGLEGSESATITVTDVNEAPSIGLNIVVSTLPEDQDMTSAIKVADIIITDDALGTNNLSLGFPDKDMFEIIGGNELWLKAGSVLDFETNPHLNVSIAVNDSTVGATPDDYVAYLLALTDVNEAPSIALTNVATTLPENTATPAKVADIVVSDDALGTNDLTLTGADAATFEIVGTELFIKAGTLLDFETGQLSFAVTINVDDATIPPSPNDSDSLTVAITDVNEAPSIELTNTVTTLPEDQDLTVALKVADIVVTDDALGTNNLSLGYTDKLMFEIVGTELYLKAGQTLDFETNPVLDVSVAVNDSTVGATPDDIAILSVDVTDVNEAPAVALANVVTTVPENSATPVKIADIVITDDALGTNDLTLTGPDAASFEIVGTELFLKAGTILDFEGAQTAFDVTVNVNDTTIAPDPNDSDSVIVSVTDVNEVPTVALANTITTLPEDQDLTAALKVADIVVTDDALGTNDLALTGADAALFEIVGTELFLQAGQTLDFETNVQLDVTVEVDDTTVGATPDDSAPLVIAVTDVNEAPAVALTNVTTAIDENTDTSAAIKVADIVVTDDALGTNGLTLSGADAASFEIIGTELFLKAGTVLDFEAQAQFNVAVDVDDATVGATPDDSAPLVLDVTDLNEPPTVVLTNTTTTLPEDQDLTAALKVADIVVTDDALGTNDLTLSGADAALFEIVGTELFIKAGSALDFETNPQLDVTVEVDDATIGAGAEDTAPLVITVTDINDPPTVALQNVVTLPEDTDTSSAVKVADIVVSDDALGSETLSLSGADAALFEIVGTELFLKAGSALDFETAPQLNVTVEVDDTTVGATPDDTAALTLDVTDVNEAPTVALANATTTLPEDQDLTAALKVADIVVTDDALGTNDLALSGADAALFEIVGTELFIKAGTALDFETAPQLNVTVEVDDTTVGATPDDTTGFVLDITDVNEVPSLELTNIVTTLPEDTDTSAAIKVADIVITDDALGTNNLSLAYTDKAMFEIVGTELFLKAGETLDFETNPSLDVSVAVNDSTVGATPDDIAILSIDVTDVNEAPTVALANVVTVPEDTDTAAAVKVADIVVTDDALGTNDLALSGADAALFEIVGTELFIKAGTVLDFETTPQLNVTVEVDDTTVGATPDDTADLVLDITDVNEAPTVALTNMTTTLPEDQDLTAALKVADIVVTDDALGTNDLALSGADAALFEIVGTELFLKAGTVLDFETNPVLDVAVEVDDTTVGATPDDAAPLAVSVTDVNEAPTVALANTTTTLPEDQDLTAALKVADIVVTDDALGTNNLALSGADAALFEIVGTELFLKAGTVLDFETNASLDVTVEVDDAAIGAGIEDSAALVVAVTDVNEAPTVALANVATVAENADTSVAIKVADIVITDDALGSETLSLSGADTASFIIVGSELFLQAGVTLDFEVQAQYNVSVDVDDTTVGVTPDDSAALVLDIEDIGEDFGDAPDPTYPTLLANNGAYHFAVGPTLGVLRDTELDGQPTTAADGDDVSTGDEDGLSAVPMLGAGAVTTLSVDASAASFLNAWIDFDSNGVWDPTEQIATDLPMVAGTNLVPVTVPLTVTPSSMVYARFRLTSYNTGATLTPAGIAQDGEVEDYQLKLDDKMHIQGTAGDDVIHIIPGTPGGIGHRIKINGAAYVAYDATTYAGLAVDGLAGNDSLSVHGKSTDETAVLSGKTLQVVEAGVYEMLGMDFENTYAYGNGGVNTATITGTTGDDNLYGNESSTYLQADSNTILNYVKGFDSVTVDATTGGTDRAYLYDGVADDVFVAGPTQAALDYAATASPGANITAVGFDRADVYGDNGGVDAATLTGSAEADRFSAREAYAYVTDTTGTFYNYVDGFESVTADVTGSGGADYALIVDSATDDVLVAGETEVTLDLDATTSPGVNITAKGFPAVNAYALFGGTDAATMTGSAGNDRFTGKETYGRMQVNDSAVINYAQGFESMAADVTGSGGTDKAFMYDTAADDTYAATPTLATYDYNSTAAPGVDMSAGGFTETYSYATSGGTDVASLTGGAGTADRFTGQLTSSYLEDTLGAYFNYVTGFDTVTANAVGAGDLAFLYGSNGDDVFDADANSGAFTLNPTVGSQVVNTAAAFDQVYAYASGGGTDTANLDGTTGADTIVAKDDWGYLRSTGTSDYFNYVRYFDDVFADPGDTDIGNDTIDDQGTTYTLGTDPGNGNVW